MLKCKVCGKTFLIAARKSEEQRPPPTRSFTETTRVLIERACCPYCESIEIEEVKQHE